MLCLIKSRYPTYINRFLKRLRKEFRPDGATNFSSLTVPFGWETNGCWCIYKSGTNKFSEKTGYSRYHNLLLELSWKSVIAGLTSSIDSRHFLYYFNLPISKVTELKWYNFLNVGIIKAHKNAGTLLLLTDDTSMVYPY